MRIINPLVYAFTVASVLVLGLGPQSAIAQYSQTNLVSDGFVPAAHTDPNLITPWGMSFAPTSPTWVANEGTGLAELFAAGGTQQALIVTIPGVPGQPGTPTGTVFNTAPSSFVLSNNSSATFLFSTLNGQIAGWNGAAGTTASIQATTVGASYTGLAISSGNPFLYAPNFAQGRIDVFGGSFNPVSIPGGFTDPNLPAGFSPFNIQTLNSQLFVTYAPQNGGQPVAGAGNGIIDIFNVNGAFIQRLVTGGVLNDPWGLALAPSNFGAFSGDLLVGNHGDGSIFAFDPITGLLIGQLKDAQGNPIINPDLWALAFGNGAPGRFDTNALIFTAGLDNNAHGLLGEIQATTTPLPAALPLFATGLGGLGLLGWRRKRKAQAAA